MKWIFSFGKIKIKASNRKKEQNKNQKKSLFFKELTLYVVHYTIE